MATYYWVGGSGTWDNANNANWATSSGGTGGFGPPTNVDVVIFDANSGTAATVTVASTAISITCAIDKSDINLSLSGNASIGTAALTLTSGKISLNSYTLTTGPISSSNTNARTIDFGTGNITISANNNTVLAFNTATNLTIAGTPVVNLTYSGGTGTRSIRWGSNTGYPITIAITINVTGGTDVINIAAPCINLNFTGFAGSLTNANFRVYGNLTFSSGMTVNATAQTVTFSGTSGTQLITTNGITIDMPFTFDGVGGTFRFEDNVTLGSTRAITLNNGTLNANGKNVSFGTFALGSGTKTLTLGSGTWTVAGATWNANTNETGLTVSASTGIISMTSASAKTFSGGGRTWPTLNQGGAGALTIAQSNTFANITNTVQPATIRLTAGTTQTVSAFSVSGTSGNQITLDTTVAGTLATLNGTTGIVNARYVNIKDIRAQGYTEWNALVDQGAVNQGNTPGWNFITLGVKKILRRVFGRQIIRPVIEEIS